MDIAKQHNVEVLHIAKFKNLVSLILPSPNLFLADLTNCQNFSEFLPKINEYLTIQMYLLDQPSNLVIDTLIENLTNFEVLDRNFLGNADMIYLIDFDDANEFDIPLEGYILGTNISPPWKI